MRMPGFFHSKDPFNPILVKLISTSNKIYTIDEILKTYPPRSSFAFQDSNSLYEKKLLKFNEWILSLPVEAGEKNSHGGRNNTLVIIIREALAQGINNEDIKRCIQDYSIRSGLSFEEGDEILKRHESIHKEEPFKRFKDFHSDANSIDSFSLAVEFLKSRDYWTSSVPLLRCWNADFYIYKGTHYEKTSEPDLKADIISFLQERAETKKGAGKSLPNEIYAQLTGIAFIPSSYELPSFLDQNETNAKNVISMKNGILKLDSIIDSQSKCLFDHTPNFFSLVSVPYEFLPEAKAPTWINFLDQMIPSKETQLLLQEWFGYNLITETKYHKFLLLHGEGANGKSVICLVLRLMLGTKNVSAVGLEAFNPNRTFPLAAMLGKIANIAEEIGDIDKAAEGLLKQFTSGGVVTVERKNRDPFLMMPTARLTFATNILPKFSDRSDGIWRRMISIKLNVQILKEEEQNKNLVDPDWWETSGELAGVFNWALEGLLRLEKQNCFSKSKDCEDSKEDYKRDVNPARIFLLDYCKVSETEQIASSKLYEAYSRWVDKNGHRALSSTLFGKEVKKVFPKVSQTNPLKQEGSNVRSREWCNIDWIDKPTMESLFL